MRGVRVCVVWAKSASRCQDRLCDTRIVRSVPGNGPRECLIKSLYDSYRRLRRSAKPKTPRVSKHQSEKRVHMYHRDKYRRAARLCSKVRMVSTSYHGAGPFSCLTPHPPCLTRFVVHNIKCRRNISLTCFILLFPYVFASQPLSSMTSQCGILTNYNPIQHGTVMRLF